MRPVSPLARIAVLAGIWGCSFLFIKVALEGVTAGQVVAGRIVLGAVALGGVALVRREPFPRDLRVWGHLALMGIVANLVPFFGFSWGEAHGATSGLAGIYNATTPLWTLLFVMLALPHERPTGERIAGLAVGFAGVVLVLAPWHGAEGARLSGQLACLGAAFCYGVSFTYTRRFLSHAGSPLGLAAAQLACATVEIAVFSPLLVHRMSLPPRVWLSLLALGALGTGFAYLIYYGLIRDVGATSASTVTYLIPVVAVTLGVVALGEQVRWNDFAGAAVVIVGILVADGRLSGRRVAVEARGSSEAPG